MIALATKLPMLVRGVGGIFFPIKENWPVRSESEVESKNERTDRARAPMVQRTGLGSAGDRSSGHVARPS